MKDIRTAILQAADHIERYPDAWNFHKLRVPDCGSPGCALGWIGYFLGMEPQTKIYKVLQILGLESDFQFYRRLNDSVERQWRNKPALAVKALRLYADKYHPAVTMPDSVREIFNVDAVLA